MVRYLEVSLFIDVGQSQERCDCWQWSISTEQAKRLQNPKPCKPFSYFDEILLTTFQCLLRNNIEYGLIQTVFEVLFITVKNIRIKLPIIVSEIEMPANFRWIVLLLFRKSVKKNQHHQTEYHDGATEFKTLSWNHFVLIHLLWKTSSGLLHIDFSRIHRLKSNGFYKSHFSLHEWC